QLTLSTPSPLSLHDALPILALNAVGASNVPLNPDHRDEEMRYILEHSEAELVVADALRARVAAAAESSGVRIASSPADELPRPRSEEHTSELQSLRHLVCRL